VLALALPRALILPAQQSTFLGDWRELAH